MKKKCSEAFRGVHTRKKFKSNLVLVAVLVLKVSITSKSMKDDFFLPWHFLRSSNISIKVKFCTGGLRVKPRSDIFFVLVEIKVNTSGHVDKVNWPLITVDQNSEHCGLELETSVIIFFTILSFISCTCISGRHNWVPWSYETFFVFSSLNCFFNISERD